MAELLLNTPLVAAFTATLIAQALKVVIVLLAERRMALDRLLETGGIPSSHSAAVAAIAPVLGSLYGVGSPYFALAAVFGSVVIYDATGIRRAAGKQAEMINNLVNELAHLFDEGFRPQVLKTLLGHTYPQVAVGVLLGVGTGLMFVL